MLPDADADHHVAVAGQLPQLLNRRLRQDAGSLFVVMKRVLLFPSRDLTMPIGDILGRLDHFVQFGEREFDVADDRDVGFLVLVDFRRIDIDVDDLAMLGELRHLAGHAVVEANAEGQQQIGLVDGQVGIDAAVHAQHVERQRFFVGKSAQAHQRHGDGNLGLADQLPQFGAGIAHDHAAARVNDRSLGALDGGRDLRDLLGPGAAIFDMVAGQVERRVVVGHDLGLLHVLGQVDQHGARPAGRGNVERFAARRGPDR